MRHVLAHRHGVDQRHRLGVGVVGIDRVILVDSHLLISVAVGGIQVVSVACAIHIAEQVSAVDVDGGTCASVVHKVAILVQPHVDISRHVVAAIHVSMDENVGIAVGRRCRRLFVANLHGGAFKHIAHKSATEDVVAVDSLQLHVGGVDRAVGAAAEHTSAEHTAGAHDMRVADHFARISATDDVHHAVSAVEVHVLFAFLYVDSLKNTSATFHHHVHIRVAHHNGVVAVSAAEHAELRRAHFVVDFPPLVARKEILAGVTSSHHLDVFVNKAFCHGEIGVVAHDARHVATGIEVVVNQKLLGVVVVLRGVYHTVYDAGWIPCARHRVPVGTYKHLSAKNQHIGVAGDVCRRHRYAFAAVCGDGFNAAESASVYAHGKPAVVDRHQRVAKHRAVLATAIGTSHEYGVKVFVVLVFGMRHVVGVVGREIFVLCLVPVRVLHHRAVEDKARVAVDAAKLPVVGASRDRAALSSGKHT